MFSFFKKKKKPEQAQSSPNISKIPPQVPSPPRGQNQNVSQVRGVTAGPIREANDLWIYEYLYQYLTSPLWKLPIFEFIDENCIVFDNEETNPFSYTEVHNNFKSLIEAMLLDTVSSLGITEEQFMKAVENGVKFENHKKVFEQLLIVENFLVFKKLMLKRNKELELEAMKALEQQEASNPVNQATNARNLERKKLETEQAQLEHAIAMSLAIEEEHQKLLEKENNELREALKLSELEFKEEGRRREEEVKKKLEEGRKKLEEGRRKEEDEQKRKENEGKTKLKEDGKKREEEDIKKQEEEEFKKREEEEEIKKNEEEGRRKEEEQGKKREEMEKRKEKEEKAKLTDSQFQKKKGKPDLKTFEEVKKKKKEQEDGKNEEEEGKEMDDVEIFKVKNIKPEENYLPPLKQDQKYDPLSLNDLLKEKQNLAARLEALDKVPEPIEEKKEEKLESFNERKKRLEKQRELILKKKREERARELKEFKETGGVGGMSEAEKQNAARQSLILQESTIVENDQAKVFEKRSELMKKIKSNLEE